MAHHSILRLFPLFPYCSYRPAVGKRFSNAVETLSDVFEMRRMDATGELFWYLKSTDGSGEKILYSAYKCEKNNLLFSNIATSAFEADYESDPKGLAFSSNKEAT